MAKGLPLLANSLQLLRDPLGSVKRWYAGLGSAYRVSYFGQRAVFMGGPQTRSFFTGDSDTLLERDFFFLNLASELDANRLIFCTSGEEHRRQRKPTALAFSRQVAALHLDEAVKAMQSLAHTWPPGSRRPLLDWSAELALAGGWPMLFGTERDQPSYRTVARFCRAVMRVSGRLRHPTIYRLPHYVEAKRKCLDFVRGELARRRVEGPPKQPDSLACLAEAALDDRDVAALAILGMVGCTVYINRVTSFMLHYAYRDRDLLAALRDEVDRAFALGLSHERLRSMSLLHGLYFEALRLHPIWFVVPFKATQDFSFDGCQIRKGELLAVSPVQEHFLAENYPDPERFDPFRCMAPRNEHRRHGVFSPYGAGNRQCIAMGMSEVLALLAAAVMIHRVDGEVGTGRLRVMLDPLPGPRTKLRYASRRTPAGADQYGEDEEQSPSRMTVSTMPPSERAVFLERLAAVDDRVYQPGSAVVREGDEGEELFLIQSGRASVVRSMGEEEGEQEIATLGAGEVFGELALLRSARRSATVRAAGDSPLLVSVIERETYLDLIRECNLSVAEIFELVRQGRMLPALNLSFPKLCVEHRAELLPLLEELEVDAGEVIVCQGDESDAMYVILEGAFEVVRDGEQVAVLGAGDYFGEVGLLQRSTRTATVRARVGAADDSSFRVAKVPPNAVEGLLERDVVREALVDVIGRRARTSQESR